MFKNSDLSPDDDLIPAVGEGSQEVPAMIYKTKVELAHDGSAKFTRLENNTVISTVVVAPDNVVQDMRSHLVSGWRLEVTDGRTQSFHDKQAETNMPLPKGGKFVPAYKPEVSRAHV